MMKLMQPLDWWDFSTPKTYIICLCCSRKMTTNALSQNLPNMELNRNGKFPKLECPELELPEKDRCSLPEMEYAGKMK